MYPTTTQSKVKSAKVVSLWAEGNCGSANCGTLHRKHFPVDDSIDLCSGKTAAKETSQVQCQVN